MLTEGMLSAMDQILREDNEATARRLRAALCKKFPSFPEVSLATINTLINHFLHFTLHAFYAKVSKENWVGNCIMDYFQSRKFHRTHDFLMFIHFHMMVF